MPRLLAWETGCVLIPNSRSWVQQRESSDGDKGHQFDTSHLWRVGGLARVLAWSWDLLLASSKHLTNLGHYFEQPVPPWDSLLGHNHSHALWQSPLSINLTTEEIDRTSHQMIILVHLAVITSYVHSISFSETVVGVNNQVYPNHSSVASSPSKGLSLSQHHPDRSSTQASWNK